jgi:hypothetical protein
VAVRKQRISHPRAIQSSKALSVRYYAYRNFFASFLPFYVDVPIACLSTISLEKLEKLLALDEKESAKLLDGCKKDGFFLLNLRVVPIGLSLLAVVEELLKVNKNLFDEGLEEVDKYTSLLGYIMILLRVYTSSTFHIQTKRTQLTQWSQALVHPCFKTFKGVIIYPKREVLFHH